VLSGATFTSFDPPGSIFTGGPHIDAEGDIIGYYESHDGKWHAYFLSGGTFTTIDPPGPPNFAAAGAIPGINPQGQIVGCYFDSTDGKTHGFVLSGGTFSTDDFPGAVLTSNSQIGATGEIVGIYQTSDGRYHGFVRTK
jgi:probable HAF family extracellular repeat protein